MSSKNTKNNKQSKTVKVSTLVKAGLVVAAIAVAYLAGTMQANAYHEKYSQDVKREAAAIVTDLKSSK